MGHVGGRVPGAPKGACGVARLGGPTRLGRRVGPWAVVAHEGLPKPPPASGGPRGPPRHMDPLYALGGWAYQALKLTLVF